MNGAVVAWATRLTCRAPHPHHPRRTCESLLGFAKGFEVLGTAQRAPEPSEQQPDGTVWIRCHREECGAWTHFRISSVDPAKAFDALKLSQDVPLI